MNNLQGILLAYRSNNRLGDLTRFRNTSALPFAGHYRLIDFMLSNYVNAGITDVGLVVHESYQSLLDHVGTGKDWNLARKRGGLRILPPFGYAQRDGGEYRGTMEALRGVRDYLDQTTKEYIILSGGDTIVNLPVADVFKQHKDSGADITMVCTSIKRGDYLDADFATLDETGRVIDLAVRPINAHEGLPSLETYILSKKLLMEMVDYCAAHDIYTFNRGVLAPRLKTLNIRAYVHHGYIARPLSISGYYRRSLELLDPVISADLFNPLRPIRTRDHSIPSTYYGPTSVVSNSVISDGCFIEGEVTDCIVSRNVTVESGAKITGCILMEGTTIHAGANVSYTITDKSVTISADRVLTGHASYPLAIAKNSTV